MIEVTTEFTAHAVARSKIARTAEVVRRVRVDRNVREHGRNALTLLVGDLETARMVEGFIRDLFRQYGLTGWVLKQEVFE